MTRSDRFKHTLIALGIFAAFFCIERAANAQAAPALTFSMTAQSTDGKTIAPVLTWSTSPAAASCTASDDWTGTKAASGTETLAAVSAAKAYTITCNWPGDTTATISWPAPTLNTDGTALAKCTSQADTGPCLRSYLVLRGSDATSVGMDSKAVDDRNATSYAWTGLAAGTHWFSVVAVNGLGIQSAQAVPPASKTITAASAVARTLTLGFKVPGQITALTVK